MKSIVTGALALALMATAATTPALADIKIGAVVSETGPASSLGDPEAKTIPHDGGGAERQGRHQGREGQARSL